MFSGAVQTKLQNVTFSISYWIYQITCYSLLLDIVDLQSRPVSILRNMHRRPKWHMMLFLLLFPLLPLALLSGLVS